MVPAFFLNMAFSFALKNLARPSVSFKTTLPVKPSATTTSALPAGMSRGSMLPTK